MPFVIGSATNITINAADDIVITGPNNQVVTIPGGKDVVITDSQGNVYNVDSAGNVSGPFAQAARGAPTPANTDGVNANGQATAFSATGVKVIFKDFAGAKYAFDDISTAANAPDYIKSEYKKVGNDYLIYKAVVNQQTDYLIAKVEVAPNATINLNEIVFKTQRGALVPSERVGTTNEFKLKVTGTQTYADEEVLATIKQGEKYKVAGAFKLVHISAKDLNVVLVPMNNKNIPTTEITKIKDIYKKAGVNVNVTIGTNKILETGGIDGKIEVGNSNILSIYTNEQKEIYNKVKQLSGYNQTTYYLIYSNLQPSKSEIKGFMALSGQFGYVFPSTDNFVAAHELGHGALGLEHPFKTEADQGKTNFLLDYSIKNELWHKDWKQINDPKFRLYNFQGDSEGASQWTTIDDKFLNLDKDVTDKKKGSFSFLTQRGKIISLNKNTLEEVLFNYGTSSFLGSGDQALGILQSFITKSGNVRKLYTYKFSDGKYYSENELFIPPVIAESKIDGVIMFVPCLDQGKIYKFQKASLENFTNANAQPNNTPIDSFPFVPFSSQNPVLKNGANIISQSFSISDGGELYAYDQVTSDMSVGHCEKPELFYILKIGQIRRNYPEAFKLFTNIDNWQAPQNSSQSNGPAGGAPTVTSYQWATFLNKPENSSLRSNYANGTNLENFFKVMYQQFSIAINTSIQSSNVFWASLNSNTSVAEVLNQLKKESVVELPKRDIAKKILAIKILQSSAVVNETFEVELLKLIKSTTEPQTAALFTFLQNEIVSGKPFLKALISDIDNSYIFGENNRVKLVAILIGLWEKSTVFKPSREALKTILDKQELTLEDQKTIMTKTVNFNYESIYSRFWTHFKFSIFPAWAQSDTYEKTNADYDNATKKIKIETLLALGFFNQQETKIPVSFDPFEPILFTNNSKLSAFEGVDVNQENSTNKIFPAFIVYYADKEAGIQTFCDTALTVVDVASLAIPGAQLKVLGKVLFYADKISSISAIAARATSDNPDLKKILNGISLFTGLASATTLVLKPSVLTKEKFVTNVIDKINEPATITNTIVKEDKEIVEAFLEKTKSSLQETGQFDNATALKYNSAINKLKNVASVSKTLLLTKFTNFPKIKAWILTLDEAIDVNLLTKLDGLDANYFARLDTDLLHPVYGNEIKTLVKESPQDLENIWQKLKDEPEFSWEIKKTGGSRWEKWGQREFFKDITAKGKGFETNVCLATFKNRTSAKYLELKQKFQTDFSKNLDDYDMYSQVQLKYDGDNYFVADQLFIKRNIDGDIIDLVVIENKLSSTTPLTTPQATAFTKNSFTVRSLDKFSEMGSGLKLNPGTVINFKNSKQLYKVHDGVNGDVISGIIKL